MPAEPTGQILSPVSGESIGRDIEARGILAGIPENQHVWLVVRDGNLLFPQDSEVTPPDGEWSLRFHQGGRTRVISLELYRMNDQGNSFITTRFEAGNYSGISRIPSAQRLDAVENVQIRGGGSAVASEEVTPAVISLSALAEDREVSPSESAVFEQVTVGEIRDPQGVLMGVGAAHDSAMLSIPTDREFKAIMGRVGITTEPCSSGTVAYVAIRDAEGHVLWPRSGSLEPIERDAQSFQVAVAGEDEVVLYATAHEAPARCGVGGYEGVNVGWLHTQLVSPE